MTPLETARDRLLVRLHNLAAPRIVGEADKHDLIAIREHAKEFAAAVDAYMHAIGAAVASNTTIPIDRSLFERPLFGALDGNALHMIARVAEALDEAEAA